MRSKPFLAFVLIVGIVTTCFAVATYAPGLLRAIDPLFYHPNSTMGSGTAIDVTKQSNTKTISGNTTLTFSATPTAGQIFGLVLTHSGVTDWTITIPSSYSLSVAATRTSFVLPVGAKAEISFRYDGSTYFISGEPLPTVTESGIQKSVYISKHTDGLPGDGTSISPLDGSTAAKFDAIMTGFYNVGPTNLVVNWSSDSFNTTFLGWAVKTGWKLRGEGMWRTTLVNTGFDIGNSACIRAITTVDNVEASDFTIDVNGSTLTQNVAGIQLRGSNNLIHRVRVIHPKSTGSECFPMFIWAGATSIYNSVIEDCEVSDLVGTFATLVGISTIGSTPDVGPINCVVRRNYIHDCAGQALGSFGNGVDCLLEDNWVYNCAAGYFSDSYDSTRLTVRNNHVNVNQFGFIMKPDDDADSRLTDTTFKDNTVILPDATDILGFWIEGTVGEIHGMTLENNTVYYSGTVQHAANQWGFFCSNVTSGLFARNNRASSILRNNFDVRDDGLSLFNNTDLTGLTMYLSAADVSPRLSIPFNVTIARASTYVENTTDTKPTQPVEGDRHTFYDLDEPGVHEYIYADGSWRDLATTGPW